MSPARAGAAPAADHLAFFAACLLLAAPVLLPPEVAPAAGALVAFVIAAGIVVAAWAGPASPGGAPGAAPDAAPSVVPASARWIVPLLPLAAVAVLSSACRARAVDEAALAVSLIAAGFLGWRHGGAAERRARIAAIVGATGTLVAVLAILQHHVLYPSHLKALGAAAPWDPIVIRLSAGRPSGPFTLPAALGAFLAVAIPCTAAFVGRGRRVTTLLAAAAVATQAYALILTRSFGALAALAVAGALAAALLPRPWRRTAWVALAVAVLVVASLFALSRRGEIVSADHVDPVSLRAGNWGAALRMSADHPLFGVGPGAFGTFYPRYMRPGMNETRYAHSSVLQAIAEWGLWIVVPLGVLFTAFVRAARGAAREPAPFRMPLVAGATAFLVHTLGDFTASLPGVALPCAVVIGAALGSSRRGAAGTAPGARPAAAVVAASVRAIVTAAPAVALATVVAAALVAQALPAARAAADLQEATEAARRGDVAEAEALARRAAAERPRHPDAWAFLSELALQEDAGDAEATRRGEEAAERAMRLDPEAAVRHHVRSVYHSRRGEGAAAYREQYAARLLNPLKELYALPEVPR